MFIPFLEKRPNWKRTGLTGNPFDGVVDILLLLLAEDLKASFRLADAMLVGDNKGVAALDPKVNRTYLAEPIS